MALVEVARFYTSFEGGLARSRLEADGIPAFLFDVEMSWEGMGLLIPVRLMVDDSDAGEARAVLGSVQGPA